MNNLVTKLQDSKFIHILGFLSMFGFTPHIYIFFSFINNSMKTACINISCGANLIKMIVCDVITFLSFFLNI